MNRRSFAHTGLGLFAGLFATYVKADPAKTGPAKTHRVVFQVNTEDRKSQQGALGNVHNYGEHYRAKGEPFEIEIVTFGPGYSMVRADMSMMKGQLENLQKALGTSLNVSACHNTRAALAENEGKKAEDIPLLAGVKETPSGVIRLAELQEQGWAYIRP